jgi:hypothetical protein
MSAVIQTQTQNTAVVAKAKKASLSGKYSKFLVFGYGFVKSLEAKGVLSAEGVESAFQELKLLSSVEEQTSLYETLLSQTAATGKVMRKFIALRNKPPSAPRAKKTPAAKPAAGGEKKARAKKSTRVENDSTSDIVGQLVAAANAPVVAEAKAPVVKAPVVKKTAEEKEAEKAAAKAAKDAAKAAAKEAKDAEKATAKAEKAAAKEGKPKKEKAPAAAKKEKAPAVARNLLSEFDNEAVAESEAKEAEAEAEEEEEEIHTQELVIKGKSYLIDEDNNVYSVDTHEQIGTFEPATQTIV